jgi:hypothetical protein
MRVNEGEIGILASAIVRALLEQGFVHPKVERRALVERIRTLLLDNVRQEEALEEEAERLAEKHARQMAGMDQRKVILGIKQRLAKERGFQL